MKLCLQAAGNNAAGCAHSAQTRTKDGPDADEWAFIDATGTAYGAVSKVMMVAFERKKLLTKHRFVYPVAKGKQGGQNLAKFEKEWKGAVFSSLQPNIALSFDPLLHASAIGHLPVKTQHHG